MTLSKITNKTSQQKPPWLARWPTIHNPQSTIEEPKSPEGRYSTAEKRSKDPPKLKRHSI
jgi:hypothetical protein